MALPFNSASTLVKALSANRRKMAIQMTGTSAGLGDERDRPDASFGHQFGHMLFYFAFKMRLDVVKSGHGKTTPD